MLLSLILVVSACSNEQEGQKTEVSKSEVKTTAMNSVKDVKAITENEKTGTFMVIAGMDCCPPSVVEDAIAQVEGAGKTAIKVNGSTAEVTIFLMIRKPILMQLKQRFQTWVSLSNKRRIFLT